MRLRLLFAIVIMMSVLAGSAYGLWAVPEEGDYLKFVASAYYAIPGEDITHPIGGGPLYGQSPGGEFKFEVYESYEAGTLSKFRGEFVTFCAEKDQYINYGGIYKIDSTIDPSPGYTFVEWIYYGYLTNQEDWPYNPVPDRWTSSSNPLDSNQGAAEIQDALWMASGLATEGWISESKYNAWEYAYGSDPNKNLRLFDTEIAVLKTVGGGAAQDQYIYIEREGGEMIPEPASLLIWSVLGLGSAGVAVWSQRRRSGLTESGSFRWSRENREAIFSLIERGRRA